MKLPDISRDRRVADLVRRSLKEDVGPGDLTSLALVAPGRMAKAVLIARTPCVISGTRVACRVFQRLDSRVRIEVLVRDGQRVKAGARILRVRGRARAILAAERTALNFIQRMTGIATLTRKYVEAARKHKVAVLDTRKTTPTLRVLEKYAVLCGGGTNHRFGLYDMILIKDNHRNLWSRSSARPVRCTQTGGGLGQAVRAARKRFPGVPIEVEVENGRDLRDALQALPEWIMLDNMPPARMRKCVRIVGGRCRIEASGGVSLKTIAAVAAAGVDAISIGRLTHSAPAADLSLEIVDGNFLYRR